MPKLKIQSRFGIIPNSLLNDPKISWKAKWLYWYLQSKPDEWDFAVSRITHDAKDGRDGTNNGLKELEIAGYLQRSKYKNEKWQWDIEYTLFDHPNTAEEKENDEETTTENPSWDKDETTTENPSTEKPSTENPSTNKKRNTKKEVSKKETYINDEKINEKFLLFIEHRKQMKKPMTEIAIDQAKNKINKWLEKYNQDQILFIISKSIENSWQWLFENQINFYNEKGWSKKLAYETNDRDNFSF